MRPTLARLVSPAVLCIAAAACGGTSSNGAGTTPENDAAAETSIDAGNPTPEAAADTSPAVDTGPDVDNGMPSTMYPAPHPDLPQLVNQAGGKTLATPKLFLIFFPSYPYEQQLIASAQKIGQGAYWTATTQEYGVGPAEYVGMLELSGTDGMAPATITDTAIDAFINSHIASGAFGTPDENTVYTIYYPQSTTITAGGPLGGSSCSSFGGYHNDTAVSLGDGGAPKNFAYAVLPTCASFGGLVGIDGVNGASSHEWVEAATDPFPSTNNGMDSAYSNVDQNHFAWEVLGGGGEAGDLCVSERNAFYKPTELGFEVQRTWSNKLAKASHDPCAPNLPGSYFNSAPVLTENVSFTSQFLGGTIQTQGVTIPVGQSKTIEVDLFSDGPTSGPWTVTALDPIAQFTKTAPTLDFAWDRPMGVNGEKLHLSVTVKAAGTLLGTAHPFVISSALGGITQHWAGIVVE